MAFSEETKVAAFRRAGGQCECRRLSCTKHATVRCTSKLRRGRRRARGTSWRRSTRAAIFWRAFSISSGLGAGPWGDFVGGFDLPKVRAKPLRTP
jgi:hypothetical protein